MFSSFDLFLCIRHNKKDLFYAKIQELTNPWVKSTENCTPSVIRSFENIFQNVYLVGLEFDKTKSLLNVFFAPLKSYCVLVGAMYLTACVLICVET